MRSRPTTHPPQARLQFLNQGTKLSRFVRSRLATYQSQYFRKPHEPQAVRGHFLLCLAGDYVTQGRELLWDGLPSACQMRFWRHD